MNESAFLDHEILAGRPVFSNWLLPCCRSRRFKNPPPRWQFERGCRSVDDGVEPAKPLGFGLYPAGVDFLQMHAARIVIDRYGKLRYVAIVEAIAGDILPARPFADMAKIFGEAVGVSSDVGHLAVIPAEAGIQLRSFALDSRFRGPRDQYCQ